MSDVPTQPQADDFMLVDYKHVLDDHETPEAVAECEWLLTTATQLVEREAARQNVRSAKASRSTT